MLHPVVRIDTATQGTTRSIHGPASGRRLMDPDCTRQQHFVPRVPRVHTHSAATPRYLPVAGRPRAHRTMPPRPLGTDQQHQRDQRGTAPGAASQGTRCRRRGVRMLKGALFVPPMPSPLAWPVSLEQQACRCPVPCHWRAASRRAHELSSPASWAHVLPPGIVLHTTDEHRTPRYLPNGVANLC